jgi:uncharacterized protein
VIPRLAEPTLHRLARGFRAVAILGPRQSGKTTLAQAAFPDKPYVSLEATHERLFASNDPQGFLARFPDVAILDEIQHLPQLFPYLQVDMDADRRRGRFVLTGSQNFSMISSIAQSLAGRAAIVQLLPLSIRELGARAPGMRLDDLLYTGAFPALYDQPLAPRDWYVSYVTTYLERDVRQIANVHDLLQFQRFVGLCAARTGQILNIASLASDCGIAQGTARSWLSVLQASYIVALLPPHHENLGKRLIKAPKLYFLDTGLAAFLIGVQDSRHMAVHAARPALFETFVVGEFMKQRFNAGLRSNLFFWRDNIGTEIDVVVEDASGLFAVEIKSGSTMSEDFFSGLRRYAKYAGARASGSGLVYGGDESYVRSGVTVRSWRDL